MSEFGILATAASGMDAQRFALDVAARNVAAAQVLDPQHPFARLVPQFVSSSAEPGDDAVELADAGDPDESGEAAPIGDVSEDAAGAPDGFAPFADRGDGDSSTIRVAGTRSMPGVDVDAVTEMVAVLNAQRAYDANASVFDAGKRLAERTIDMGRL